MSLNAKTNPKDQIKEYCWFFLSTNIVFLFAVSPRVLGVEEPYQVTSLLLGGHVTATPAAASGATCGYSANLGWHHPSLL